ncbi:XRE family transcriptional regulator [bacterium D16-50]|nr:XRE family transcriptional regulator [bacterium D16-50]
MFFRLSSRFRNKILKNIDKIIDFSARLCYIGRRGGDSVADSQSETRLKIAELLKEYREAAGLTVRQVEELTGKSYKTVSAWEKGRGQPDADMFLKLCDIYNVPSVGLFFGESLPEPELAVDERELLESWREATDAARESALMVLKSNKRPLVKKGKAM